MVNFRQRQQVNRRATVALICAMVGCILLACTPMTYFMHSTSIGWLLAVCAFACIIPLLSYWFSDALVLRATGAHVVTYTEARELHNIVDEVRIAAGLPMPRVAIICDPTPNALATGRNPDHAVVAFTTGMLDSMTRDEIQGVAAHELGHIANRDTLLMSIAASIAAVLWLMFGILAGLATRRDEKGKEEDGRPAAMAVMAFAPILITYLNAGMSRRRESLADATAIQFTRNPAGLRSALERLRWFESQANSDSAATAHMWFSARTSWRGRLLATHPPLEDRIARLRAMEGVG